MMVRKETISSLTPLVRSKWWGWVYGLPRYWLGYC